MIIVHQILRQNDNRPEGGPSYLFEQPFHIKPFEVAGHCIRRQANMPEHDVGERSVPATHP
jgi:hypothetical protein